MEQFLKETAMLNYHEKEIQQLIDMRKWKGEDTFVQKEAIVCDYGIFQSPDEFFRQHRQHFHWVNSVLYIHFGRKIMTRNVERIRRRNAKRKGENSKVNNG